jgi:MFS family permease
MRSFSKMGLGAVSATTMATTTFPIVIVSVLAASLIAEFEISRAQLGLLVTAFGLVGALLSPVCGRLTDRFGAVRSTTLTMIAGAVTLVAVAFSPTYAVLIGAALLGGFPNGWGNPSTNALIADNVEVGSRGVVTGVKQSGVQAGIFLGGLLLPIFAVWWNWRVAVLIFIAMPIGGLLGMIGRKDTERDRPRTTVLTEGKLPTSINWIAAYGMVSGLATSALIAFLPLFAEEDQLWSETMAGIILAAVGFTGIFSRIIWSRWAEQSLGHGRTLRILAWMTTVTSVLLALASLGTFPSWVLVPAAFLFGAGAMAWNAVGMVAVMEIAPTHLVGKGTGVVLLGFLFGHAIGPPMMGWSVDTFGTYTLGWLATGVLMATSALLALRIPDGGRVAVR